MQITKFVQSCLLVKTDDRVAIFDPGSMSESSFDWSRLDKLDDIFITHSHQDHISLSFLKTLLDKFPNARITTTPEVVRQLADQGIEASDQAPEGVTFFEAPHENVEPLFPMPETEIGVHYLDTLTVPGDSHSFTETKDILALPITAPWGRSIKGLNLVLELKPKYVLPIHDWHWSEDARKQMYASFEAALDKEGIKFIGLETGVPIEIDI